MAFEVYNMLPEYTALLDMYEEEPENEAITETLNAKMLDIEDETENLFKLLRNVEAQADAIKTEKLRLAKRQASYEAFAKKIRDGILISMLVLGKKKIKRTVCTLSVSTLTKPVIDVPTEEIPKEFQKVTIEAKNADIKKWINDGNACSWAHLESYESLTVR